MKQTQRHPQIPKKLIDRILERLRFAKAKSCIPKGTRLLDIGTGDGAFLRFINGHVRSALGIDPLITTPFASEKYTLLPGTFPHDFEADTLFDVITMLAVVEHIPHSQLHKIANACYNVLTPSGRIIITAPHPFADKILNGLKFIRLIHGLSLEQHYGFDPQDLPHIFKQGKLIKMQRWELGLNYLFVFEKCE